MKGPIYRTPHEKFLRDAEHEVQRQARHRVKVRYDGRFRAVCSCAWVSDACDSQREAEDAGRAHVAGRGR